MTDSQTPGRYPAMPAGHAQMGPASGPYRVASPGRPNRLRLSRKAVIWSILGGLLFCCCSLTGLGALLGDPEPASDVSPEPTMTASSAAATTAAPVVPTPAAPPTGNAPPPATSDAPPPPPPPPPPPQNDPRFGSCAEAIRNGYGPYYKGKDPEYAWYEDRDGDGVVCEKR